MNTHPTPTPVDRQIEGYRAELQELIKAVKQPTTAFVRVVILDAMLGVFERTAALVAPPRGVSDTSGDNPDDVSQSLFREPATAELVTMPRAIPNGIEVNA